MIALVVANFNLGIRCVLVWAKVKPTMIDFALTLAIACHGQRCIVGSQSIVGDSTLEIKSNHFHTYSPLVPGKRDNAPYQAPVKDILVESPTSCYELCGKRKMRGHVLESTFKPAV